jgi:hypothetical protein
MMTIENEPYFVGYKKPPAATQFKRGVSGNPGGNFKKTPHVDSAYKRLGAMSLEDLRAYVPAHAIEYAVKNAILRACEASDWQAAHAALKELADRIDGKPVQTKVVEHTLAPETRQQILAKAYFMLFSAISEDEALATIRNVYRAKHEQDEGAMMQAVIKAIELESEVIEVHWQEAEKAVLGERIE